MVMYVHENHSEVTRLGLSAGKRYGNSIERHRFQRRMREIFMRYKNVTKSGYDMIIVARNKAKYASFQTLCSEHEKLLIGHDILKDRNEL